MRIAELAKMMNKTPGEIKNLLIKQDCIELKLTESQ